MSSLIFHKNNFKKREVLNFEDFLPNIAIKERCTLPIKKSECQSCLECILTFHSKKSLIQSQKSENDMPWSDFPSFVS